MIMKSNFIIVSVLLFLIGCKPNNQNTDVKYSGALRTMMSGDIKATASLDSLSKKQHLYALGAFENLIGETQIFDGKAPDAITFFHQTKQNVFRGDILVVESLGFLIGQLDDLSSPICKSFVHAAIISFLLGRSRKMTLLETAI
jgi:hypothetical protein